MLLLPRKDSSGLGCREDHNRGEKVEPDASGSMKPPEGKELDLEFLHLKCFAAIVDSHILIFQDSVHI